MPLNIRVPWPFLVDNIQPTLRYQKAEENCPAKLILKKSLTDAWPSEFENCSRWNFDRLPKWNDAAEVNSLAFHLGSQFSVTELAGLTFGGHKPTSALDEVRLIMQSILSQNFLNGHTIFAVKDGRQSRSPIFYLRAHPPLRKSPQGSPMLLMTVIDHHLGEKLLSLGKVNKEQSMGYFMRIFVNAPGAEKKLDISVYSTEEIDLLRYLLRLNSTKIQPSVWQSKNLPKEENWFATFVSPLYMDCIHSFSSQPTAATNDRCAHCYSVKEGMKRCAQCKTVLYCDVNCQKADWKKHKINCSI